MDLESRMKQEPNSQALDLVWYSHVTWSYSHKPLKLYSHGIFSTETRMHLFHTRMELKNSILAWMYHKLAWDKNILAWNRRFHTRMIFSQWNSHGQKFPILAWMLESILAEPWYYHTRIEILRHTRKEISILAWLLPHTRTEVLQRKLAWENITYSHAIFHSRIFSKNRLRNSRKYVKTWKTSYLKPLFDPSSKSIKPHIK